MWLLPKARYSRLKPVIHSHHSESTANLVLPRQKAKGSLFLFGWYHMLEALKKNDILGLLLIAINEKYKNKGVNTMIFDIFARGIKLHAE